MGLGENKSGVECEVPSHLVQPATVRPAWPGLTDDMPTSPGCAHHTRPQTDPNKNAPTAPPMQRGRRAILVGACMLLPVLAAEASATPPRRIMVVI